MSQVLVAAPNGQVIGSMRAPELDAIIQPRVLTDGVDSVLGYLDEFEPAAYLTLELDDETLFPVTHAEFQGAIATRSEFHYFNAWLERELIVNPKMTMTLDDMIPRIVRIH